MAGSILRAAVVGGSTLLGRELLHELGNSATAAWDLQILEEGEGSEGQLTSAGDEALVVHTLNKQSFSGLDVVFFAATPEITNQYLQEAMLAGAAIVDLSGEASDHPGMVMRSPWIARSERPDLTTTGICVPHPAALMLAIAGERLQRRFGAVALVATVLEPASQAGSAGVDELHQQTVSLLSFQDMPKTVFGSQVAFNLQGFLAPEAHVDLGATLVRVRQDTERLLRRGSGVTVRLHLLQAPVFHGYVISAHAHCERPVAAQEMEAALDGDPVVLSAEMSPSNKTATESGELQVSLRFEDEDKQACWLLLAADNLGLMARSAVSSALELAALRPAARVQ